MSRIFAPFFMLGALMLCVVLPARGDDVPFAQTAPSANPHGEFEYSRAERCDAIDAIAPYEALVRGQGEKLASDEL